MQLMRQEGVSLAALVPRQVANIAAHPTLESLSVLLGARGYYRTAFRSGPRLSPENLNDNCVSAAEILEGSFGLD